MYLKEGLNMERYKDVLLNPIYWPKRMQKQIFIQAMECTDADSDGNPSKLTVERYSNLF